jgi:hypothetical protein
MAINYKGIEISDRTEDNYIEARISDKLTEKDYEVLVPELERRIDQFGGLRLLIELHDFRGWDIGALWEDLKFDFKHYRDIDRIAIVGENRWHKTGALFARPFTGAEVRYFEKEEIDAAREWVRS